ncbi:hypothetical protein [Kribbella sp. NPDC048928]|uniref:hypothetical protein n=1 Tax=Kribbella sp. NPDC048928 TaxID=3364111 RepID=UPI0037224BEF
MTRAVGRVVVGFYPRAIRERWGQDLAGEIDREGWRGLPQLAVAIAGMWLHPAIWPTSSSAERRRRVAALTVLVVGAGWLTAHAVFELTGAVPRAITHSWLLTACDLVTFAGFLMAVPVPRLRRTALARLAWTVIRRLTLPFGAGAAVVYAANHDTFTSPMIRVLVVVGWWLILVLAASQVVRTVADVDLGDVLMPGPRRLGLGLWLVAFGLAVSGVTILIQALTGGSDRVAGFLGGAAVLALGVSVNGTVRDLAEVRLA